MKNLGFIIVFSIILIIYAFFNYYIIKRGLAVAGNNYSLRMLWICVVSLLSVSFIIGRFLEHIWGNNFSTILIWIGSFWLGIMFYLLLQLFLIDIIKFADRFFHFLPEMIYRNPIKIKKYLALIISASTFVIILSGFINTWFPKVKQISLHINKKAGHIKRMHIVAFSDVHLGTTIEKKHLRIIVDKVNALRPDIILIPGDLIDEDIAPVIRNNVGEVLTQLKSKYGVYACTGNHEYIGGVEKAKKYMQEHQINILNDTAVLIDNSFYIAGREDITIKQFKKKKRKGLKEILQHIDTSLPVILLDHQPFNLKESMEAGVDLQLSGHTHHGQLFPLNFITNAIFEKGTGYIKKGNTHFYISKGIGTWGPPVRTSSRPEIVSININFY